jgi:hypothetical protein
MAAWPEGRPSEPLAELKPKQNDRPRLIIRGFGSFS